MPYRDPDPSDPQLLVGVMFPGDPESTREMAYVFAEELARMGWSTERILRTFRNPHYRGAHRTWKALGEETIRAIAAECIALWGRIRLVDREPDDERAGGEE